MISRNAAPNGLFDGGRAASMQTANYMTDCCMEEEVIRDVVTDLKDCIHLIMRGDVKEIPTNGQYIGGTNNAYVENYMMSFCKSKRTHFQLLQRELIPMDVIRLIVLKGAPKDCRDEVWDIIMSKSWTNLDKDFINKVANQEDFPQMLQTYQT